MTPDDLSKLRVPADVRLSIDGTRYAFVVSAPDVASDKNVKRIWVGAGDSPRQFSAGPEDSAPRWSPDGSQLVFLRKPQGSPKQAAVIPANGGEPTIVTDFELGVEEAEWSPDGSTLVVVAITYTDEWSGLDEEERGRSPRRITSVPYRFDGRGWIHDRRRHLWLIDPRGETEPRCLTPGAYDEEYPAWSPGGKTIAFISSREENTGLVQGNHVWEVDVESGEITEAVERGHWVLASYRSDGALHVLGNTDHNYPVDSYLYRREDDRSLTNLTGHLDRSSYAFAIDITPIRWSGNHALVGVEDAGSFGVISVAPDGEVTEVISGARVVTSFDAHIGVVAFTASSWSSPGEVFILTDDGEQEVTALTPHDLELTEPNHFRIESADTDVDVWVYLPAGDDPLPLLLNVHGGPASQFGFGFFDEFQVYAAAGYGVVACNPRGSSGRGIAFNRAVVGEGWGKVDYIDVLAAVESALERYPRLDEGRMGVMGGSYGGFMTAWMIGHENRWRSAVVERALLSWTSFAGTSDIGGLFPQQYTGGSYPDAWETWWRLSPLSLAENVATPTLIIHSENDFRCPIEQAEQYFMALLRNGTTAELIRFPDEGHELSRSGRPRHRLERFRAILDWHERHLR